MSNTEVRTDIRMQDVFISWTGKDRDLKNQIVGYLRENGITVLESDHDCVGDFRQWSREAVSKCTVFLSLYTENTINSEYVPIEIDEFKKLDDWHNRCLPVVSDYALYSEKQPDLAESESAVVLNGRELNDAFLEEILHKVQMLINNRLFKIYRNATQPTYLKLKSFLRMVNVRDREFNYETLYIHRTVTDENENAIDDASVFATSEDILFLQGPAGSGKSCYIDQLRKSADENVLVMALSCRKLTDTSDIFKAMFDEFRRHCGDRHFYTEEDFKSLLSAKHLLLVLDGMDEIATKNGTRQFLDAVSDYYQAHASSTTLFFTSRNGEDADVIAMNGQSPKRLTLCPLKEEQIEDFGKNLFLLLEKPDKSDKFYVCVKDLADEIRTNPLLLSQLAIIYDKKDDIPQTTVGIYDAVCEITFSRENDVTSVPDKYRDMVTLELSSILKAFSAERYRLISLGKQIETVKILSKVMKNTYTDAKERAVFLEEYLRDRAMIMDGEFYHKMLLEYFTAVYYYEHCFDDYDELENEETLKDLFAHYNDSYWSDVIQLFLVKADSLTDEETTSKLYETLMTYGITEYTLLFDTCRDHICHKEEAQRVLVGDILTKSAEGTYLPYGPLFWYVPEYNLYAPLLLALENIIEEPYFTKALALTRDVCWIFGHYNTANEITDRINGKELFAKSNLNGIRRGLCELFYTGDTNETGGDDIYPRCFNLAEAKNWKEQGQGVLGRMNTAFEDELGLYSHEMFSELDGEYIGIVAAPYDKERLESVLSQKSCKKLCGLFLSPRDKTEFEQLEINDKHLKRFYVPENTQKIQYSTYVQCCLFENMLVYFNDGLILPEWITVIERNAFRDCLSLTAIQISNNVTAIEAYAFSGCTLLDSIAIPDSVLTIDHGAFEGCTSLAFVSIGSGLTELKSGVFKNCRSLTSIQIPDNVNALGDWWSFLVGGVFEGCNSLSSVAIPDSVVCLEKNLFKGCSSLASISLPSGVYAIPEQAFEGCISLESLTIQSDMMKIERSAFKGCLSLKHIQLSDSLEHIGTSAFEGCSALTSITIPNSITTIDADVFQGCTSLSSISIGDRVTTIGASAFKNCEALNSVTIPNNVQQIGDEAFQKCISLTEITIPNNVRRIGDRAFQNCSKLASITISDGIESIGLNAFQGCICLQRIYNCPSRYTAKYLGVSESCLFFPNNTENTEVFMVPFDMVKINAEDVPMRNVLTKAILHEAVTAISPFAFCGCICLKSINIPNSVTIIGKYAFSNCSQLNSIAIPDSVTTIEMAAFSGCHTLTSIRLPSIMTRIEMATFFECRSLASITIPDSITAIDASAFNGCSALTSITLPNSVISIENMLFNGCSALKTITMGDDVTSIGTGAFRGCSSLISIKIPFGVGYIGTEAFCGCETLEEVVMPNKAHFIGPQAFSGCRNLKSIELPNGITFIGADTFNGCRNLMSIVIPGSVTEIGSGAFRNCGAVTLITIPDGIKHIEARTFEECSKLISIIIPVDVKKIGARAFAGCRSLTSISIPVSVSNIGDGAFAGCIGLKEITISHRFEEDLPRIFSGVDLSKITIHWI